MRRGTFHSLLVVLSALFIGALVCPQNLTAASSRKKEPVFPEVTSWPARDYRESLKSYTETIKKKPWDAVAHYNRAMVYFALGDNDKAIEDFDRAIALRPGELQPFIGKLGALYAAGRYAEVLDLSNQVLNGFNNHRWGYYWRGRSLLATGQSPKAIEDFKKFLEKEEDPVRIADVCYYLGSAYFESGEYNAAIQQLNMAIVKNPLNFETWILRGIVYKSKIEYRLALHDLRRGFEISGRTSLLACNSIAWILATCPNPDFRNGAEAVSMARLAVNIDGSKPYYHDTLAAAFAEAGNFQDAMKEEKMALKLLEKLPDNERTEISTRYQKRLEMYSIGKPYRDMEE